jgi:regulator of protease activity HflC (stomatin/prohibitin superfamily)
MGGRAVITAIVVLVVTLAVIAGLLAAASVRVLREYERAVVFRLGRLLGQKGPGLVLLIPAVDRMVRVDLRTIVLDIPPQAVITRDNVPAKVNAVCYFRVVDATRSTTEVERFLKATSQIAQTTLRSVLGKAELDTLLAEREKLNDSIQQTVDEHTEPWGIKVTAVEIRDVEIPSAMQRAMALQAEAERERRAKIIHAEGEFQASKQLRNAADVISGNPATLQLRYLQTLTEIGATQNSTVVFPLPLDIINAFMEATGKPAAAAEVSNGSAPELDEGARPALPEGANVSQAAPRKGAVGSPRATQ